MIKLEHVVLASPEQMKFIIEGMRNPMNSWEKSDSRTCRQDGAFCMECEHKNNYCLGENDHSLMQRLSNAGTDHRKFMRMLPVYVRITAPLYWWKEFDTYKVGTVANSCSTMHKIQAKEFTMDDFSCEHLMGGYLEQMRRIIDDLNNARKYFTVGDQFFSPGNKRDWWQMIQLLPSSYNQTRNVMLNYEVLANIYRSRKNHKLDEWREFCEWIGELPYSELIVGEQNSKPMTPDEINTLVDIQKKRFGEPFPWIKEKVEKVASELHPIVDGCPCKGCSDSTRAYCKSETCEKYSEWFSKLKED